MDSSDRLLLDSILRNRAYSSVDELCDDYDSLYSGARGLMTDSGGSIFDAPIAFSGYNIMEKSADVVLPESCLHYDTDGEYIITAKPNEKYEDGIYNASRTKINYEITGNILIVKNGVDSGSMVITDNIGVGERCVLNDDG